MEDWSWLRRLQWLECTRPSQLILDHLSFHRYNHNTVPPSYCTRPKYHNAVGLLAIECLNTTDPRRSATEMYIHTYGIARHYIPASLNGGGDGRQLIYFYINNLYGKQSNTNRKTLFWVFSIENNSYMPRWNKCKNPFVNILYSWRPFCHGMAVERSWHWQRSPVYNLLAR